MFLKKIENIRFIFLALFSLKTVLSLNITSKGIGRVSLAAKLKLLNSDFKSFKNKTVDHLNLQVKREELSDTVVAKVVPLALKKFQALDFSSDTNKHQFCGETLFYAIEYYCVYIKGTSVYTPETDYDADNANHQTKRDTGKFVIFNF
jgi:hypothetical protein